MIYFAYIFHKEDNKLNFHAELKRADPELSEYRQEPHETFIFILPILDPVSFCTVFGFVT